MISSRFLWISRWFHPDFSEFRDDLIQISLDFEMISSRFLWISRRFYPDSCGYQKLGDGNKWQNNSKDMNYKIIQNLYIYISIYLNIFLINLSESTRVYQGLPVSITVYQCLSRSIRIYQGLQSSWCRCHRRTHISSLLVWVPLNDSHCLCRWRVPRSSWYFDSLDGVLLKCGRIH